MNASARILAFLLLVLSLLTNQFATAQQNGKYVYEFVTIPQSARAAALGNVPLAINDGDLALATINPALLNASTTEKLSLNVNRYIADITLGNATYCTTLKKIPGTVAAGITYLNSGKNTRIDQYGISNGTFYSNEFCFNFSYSRQFDSCFAIGAIVKPVLSYIGGYSSIGLLADVSALYSPNSNLCATLLIRNIGAQITSYYGTDTYKVPFEIDAALAYKLAYAPFRICLQLQHLKRFKLKHSQTSYAENGVDVKEENVIPNFIDNSLRHLALGIEFVPAKSFNIRVGYNHKTRQELKLADSPDAAGLSWGLGLNLKKFQLSYANARYHLASRSNSITFSTRLSNWN